MFRMDTEEKTTESRVAFKLLRRGSSSQNRCYRRKSPQSPDVDATPKILVQQTDLTIRRVGGGRSTSTEKYVLLSLGEDCVVQVLQFLPLRAVLRFSECSKASLRFSSTDLVWGALANTAHARGGESVDRADTTEKLTEGGKEISSSAAAASPVEVEDVVLLDKPTRYCRYPVKRQVLQRELKSSRRRLDGSTLRCMVLQRRWSDLLTLCNEERRRQEASKGKLQKLRDSLERIHQDVNKACGKRRRTGDAANSFSAFLDNVSKNTDTASDLLQDPVQQSSCSSGWEREHAQLMHVPGGITLSRSMGDAVRRWRDAIDSEDSQVANGSGAEAAEESATLVLRLVRDAERQQRFHASVVTALMKWMEANGGK